MLRTVLLISCLISIKTVVFCADCDEQACLTNIFNARVTKAEYYIRPLGSSWSGSSIGRRKKRHDYHLHHAGVVVTLDQYAVGRDKRLIHKGSDYGDALDTVITDASYMGSSWTKTKVKYLSTCRYTVNSFMVAAKITSPYNLFGPNCQTAANAIWDLIEHC
ncbi:uncharacterized protein LOC143042802 [Mytilus galloprovincialis]|uniref:uncharacterized protein LOC143042802 n=1 Tax=Mytilus galloprovincialis TaxID=29158 RepID=UPI003F7B7BB0